MSIAPQDLQVGRCYATPENQHRRITKIEDGKVTYESWGGNVGYQGGSLSRTTASADTFLNAVEKVIPCDAKLPPLP